MDNLIILIPPSEGKNPEGKFAALKKPNQDVSHMVDKMQAVEHKDWAKILGVKGKALEKAIEANQQILDAKTLPAIERYTGVVYKAIDYPSLSVLAKKTFDQHVRMVSAVFGLVKPQDKIPDYKLKIDKLGADKFWKPIIQKKLTKSYVVDLLPKAHQKAVAYDQGLTIDFNFIKNGKSVPAGHHGKHIKGCFIRWLVQQKSITEKTFYKFEQDGFRWDGSAYTCQR